MSQELPGGVKYNIILNWFSIVILGLSVLIVALGVIPQMFISAPDSEVQTSVPMMIFASILMLGIPGGLLWFFVWLNRGLKRLDPVARNFQVVLSIFCLIPFPVGTVVYGIALYFLLGNPEVKAAFQSSSG